MKKLLFAFLFITHQAISQTPGIIPQPVSITISKGNFSLSKNTVLIANDADDVETAKMFNDYLQQFYGLKLQIKKPAIKPVINSITFTTLKFIKAPEHEEGYSLKISNAGTKITGNSYAGTFYGMQTLIQLLPVDHSKTKSQNSKLALPLVAVEDYPRFSYRGMHFDVCRHFFPVSYVKKYIDYLALHKINTFHWHLTDDQGWRIEIKKYPLLTSVGGWRNGTIIGRYPGIANDNTRHGGFYTQEQAREIVKYAAERHITVIPEIEMPGHSSAAIAAYPWLSCFPGEETKIPTHPSEASKNMHGKKVQETWGVFEDIFCAGKDSTFQFLQDVLEEVLPLFPSKYIHVGGDEAPKASWKRCPNCQARMKENNLKDEHELQSYFIQRMEKYLNSRGKTLIGWDEILEGGLAPNAVVMSWRGEKGGIEAARQNHMVIMTPQKPMYFDHTQTKNEDSVVIGGYNPIEQVYAYEPIPKDLDSTQGKFILGAQANLWTEYIGYPSKVEYMVFPRMSALSEVLWSAKEKRNWSDFEQRLPGQLKRYELWKANYSKAYYDINVSILPTDTNDGLLINASSKSKEGKLGYVPGHFSSLLLEYTSALKVSAQNPEAHLMLYKEDKQGHMTVLSSYFAFFHFNKATGKKTTITKTPNEKYPGQGGAFSLVNGVYSNKGLSYPDWLGWIGDDMEATIDFGKTTSFDSVRMHTLEQNGSWIYLPQYVEVLSSNDGINYTSLGKSSQFVGDTLTMGWITVILPKQQSARYIKVVAKNYGVIPEGKPGGGTKAWLFADELQVY